MSSTKEHLEEKKTAFNTWESSAKDFVGVDVDGMHINDVKKNIKKAKTLIDIYQSCRNWWEHDIEEDKLHHAQTLKKHVTSNLSLLERKLKKEKKCH